MSALKRGWTDIGQGNAAACDEFLLEAAFAVGMVCVGCKGVEQTVYGFALKFGKGLI